MSRMADMLARAGQALADLVCPRHCALCGGEVCDEYWCLCYECARSLPLIDGDMCKICGSPADGEAEGEWTCVNCQRCRPRFDAARSAARYTGAVAELVQEFKYRRGIWLCRDLASLLEAAFLAHFGAERVDGIAYVPLHRARERERGYNQAGLLAAELAGRLGLPLLRGALARTRATLTQTGLTAAGRTANVKGAFVAWKPDLAACARLLLVDDVMTTGATTNECAAVLKKAGVESVLVLTVARR